MQHKAVYLLFCEFTQYVSGPNNTHHQEYTYCNYSLQYLSYFLQLPPSNMTKLAWPRWREVASQYRRL